MKDFDIAAAHLDGADVQAATLVRAFRDHAGVHILERLNSALKTAALGRPGIATVFSSWRRLSITDGKPKISSAKLCGLPDEDIRVSDEHLDVADRLRPSLENPQLPH